MRHGETEWSKSGQHTGRTDIPLTEAGRRQAEALGRHLERPAVCAGPHEPLARARETCRLAGYGDGAEVTDDLLEWDYGIYEGRRTADIQKEQPGWSIWATSIPKGETVEQVGERVRRVIARAVAAPGDVALFAHAHVLRILSACWLGAAAGGRPTPRPRDGVHQRPRLRARDARDQRLESGLAARARSDSDEGYHVGCSIRDLCFAGCAFLDIVAALDEVPA